MNNDPPNLHYDATSRTQRRWGLSRSIWLLIAGFCIFVLLAAWFATNGRINGWPDVLFVILFALVTLVALLNGLRPNS